MVGKTKTPSKSEKHRMTVLKENVPCIPCLVQGKVRLPSIQHTVSGMKRDGHLSTYSSCEWHHFAVPLENWEQLPGSDGGANQATSGLLGPSIAHGKRTFVEFFGSELLLISIASRLVKSFDQSPWMDYDVPYDIQHSVKSYWEGKV